MREASSPKSNPVLGFESFISFYRVACQIFIYSMHSGTSSVIEPGIVPFRTGHGVRLWLSTTTPQGYCGKTDFPPVRHHTKLHFFWTRPTTSVLSKVVAHTHGKSKRIHEDNQNTYNETFWSATGRSFYTYRIWKRRKNNDSTRECNAR